MELIFLGTGPGKPLTEDGRTRSSLAVKTKETTFLIDCTPDILEQVEREKIDKIDFILITHAHADAMGGLSNIKEWLDKKDLSKLTVFMEKETALKVRSKFKSLSHLDIRYFNPYNSFSVNNIKITPFKVTHSIQQDIPCCGFRFLDMVYSNDVGEVPEKSMRYYDDANIVMFDASIWFEKHLKGHHNTAEALQFAKKIKPKQFISMQAGSTYPSQPEAEAQINQYWKEIHGGATKIQLAYDGLRLILREHISQVLYETKEGISLVEPHAYMIHTREKNLIVKSKLFKNKVNKFLYLIEDSLCYGVIQLKIPDKINLLEFDKLKDKHKITEEERKKWWPQKEILYSYSFDIIKLFDSPKKIEIPNGIQTFVKDFKFLNEDGESIKDPKSYNPEKISTAVLKDDWRIVNTWYASKKRGTKLNHSIEEIMNLAKTLYLELKKREVKFHPETMKSYSKDLYKKMDDESLEQEDLSNPELLKEFDDKIIIKDFISVVGSSDGGSNDVDMLIRMSNPVDLIKKAVEVKLLKNVSFSDNLHFVWGDPDSPHDTFVPLYDLQLRRIKPLKVIKMSADTIELNSIMPFYSMKPKKIFYQVDEAIEYMFKAGDRYALEKKFDGLRVVLIKTGDRVKIYSDQKEDISKHFHTILSEARNLSNKDYIIDTELVYKDGGTSEISEYITGKGELDDLRISLQAFDCIYYGKDISNLDWNERKSILHSLNFTEHIKEVHSILSDNPNESKNAIKFLQNLKGSEGVMIKRYKGKYTKNGETDAWIKFLNASPGDTTTATPGIKDISGKIIKKPIQAPKKKKNKLEEEAINTEDGI